MADSWVYSPYEGLMKYSRSMLVPQFGPEGQEALSSSSVCVIGCGGIGSSVILYLAGAGVGKLTLVDNDCIEKSNLHRQVIHSQDGAEAGLLKVDSAASRAAQLNKDIKIVSKRSRLTSDNADAILAGNDLVVDATDNFEARYVINEACVKIGIPCVSGSAVGMEGQVTVLHGPLYTGETLQAAANATSSSSSSSSSSSEDSNPTGRHHGWGTARGPCYRCLYPRPSPVEGCRACADAGVLGPVPGLVGCLQATEVIKLLVLRASIAQALEKKKHGATNSSHGSCSSNSGRGDKGDSAMRKQKRIKPLVGRQLFYDAELGEFETFTLPSRNPACQVCGSYCEPIVPPSESYVEPLHPSRLCPEDSCVRPLKTALNGPDPNPNPNRFQEMSAVHFFENELCRYLFSSHSDRQPILLIDVRPKEQFRMLHLSQGALLSALERRGRPEWVAALTGQRSQARVIIANITLREIKQECRRKGSGSHSDSDAWFRVAAMATRIERQSILGLESATMAKVEAASVQSVFLLCRRGVDSAAAAGVLLQAGAPNVVNISGGLDAWRSQVDPNFPEY